MIPKPPITPAALPENWIAVCREAMNQHEGVQVRGNPLLPELEAWSINRKAFMPIQLPGGGTLFESFEQRNEVLRQLQGKDHK